MRTTILRITALAAATTLAACSTDAPTGATHRAPSRPATALVAGCNTVQGSIDPYFGGLWPEQEDGAITGSFIGTTTGYIDLIASDATGHNTWQGPYYINTGGDDVLKVLATLDLKRNTGTSSLEVNQVTGTLEVVEGWGKYAGATGVMQVSGTAGYYLNEPKSRANLHYHGTVCLGPSA